MCHDNEERCRIWRGIDLSFQNWQEKFDEFWPEHSKVSKRCTLMGCFWTKYIMFEPKKYRGFMFHDTEEWWEIWRKLTSGLENDMRNLTNFHRLKNSDFILESKMAELNQNKNSKQLDRPSALRNFILLGHKWIAQLARLLARRFLYSTELLFLRYKKIFKKAVKTSSFLQWSVHVFLDHDGCFWNINLRILWNHIMKQ